MGNCYYTWELKVILHVLVIKSNRLYYFHTLISERSQYVISTGKKNHPPSTPTLEDFAIQRLIKVSLNDIMDSIVSSNFFRNIYFMVISYTNPWLKPGTLREAIQPGKLDWEFPGSESSFRFALTYPV